MGYEYEATGDYAFFSGKRRAFLEQAVGAVVWAISGSDTGGKKTTYRLDSVYIPDQIIDVEDPEFDYVIAGAVGRDFDPPIELNLLPWFPSFFESQGHFGFGFNEITDPQVVQELLSLAGDPTPSNLAASAQSGLPLDVDVMTHEASEGLKAYVAHLRRERNRSLVEAKKRQALAQCGRLSCEACGFDFAASYGQLGEGYCEVHHKIPLASLETERVTKLTDLAVVCSNCHRILHRKIPMPSISELKACVLQHKG